MPAGPSVNLVATRGDVVPGEPWLLVGAHLDTVPQAPGAEDNASGIGVLLATAEALAGHRTRLPVVLVAFGSEEPRGQSDADHHYGSTAYVDSLTGAAAPDPARHGGHGPGRGRGRGAGRLGVRAGRPVGRAPRGGPQGRSADAGRHRQKSSDHWSFVQEGMPGARLGGTSYAEYHSADDVPLWSTPRSSSAPPVCWWSGWPED